MKPYRGKRIEPQSRSSGFSVFLDDLLMLRFVLQARFGCFVHHCVRFPENVRHDWFVGGYKPSEKVSVAFRRCGVIDR